MTTRYKLPEILGGREFDGEAHGEGVILDVPGHGNLLMPTHYLTEVKPPLPPEPGPLAVVRDRHGMAWQREAGTGSPDWLSLGDHKTWQELNADLGPLTLLVPDPADDAPELPWECDDAMDDGDLLTIGPARRTDLAAFIKTARHGVRLTATHARQAAAVLLRAAREVQP